MIQTIYSNSTRTGQEETNRKKLLHLNFLRHRKCRWLEECRHLVLRNQIAHSALSRHASHTTAHWTRIAQKMPAAQTLNYLCRTLRVAKWNNELFYGAQSLSLHSMKSSVQTHWPETKGKNILAVTWSAEQSSEPQCADAPTANQKTKPCRKYKSMITRRFWFIRHLDMSTYEKLCCV